MRRNFPAKVRAAVLRRCSDANGIPHCERCTAPGFVEIHHKQADGLGGEPTIENAEALCKTCHDAETRQQRPVMAKADRQRKRHYLGRRPSARPMIGTKASGWKRKVNGELVRR